MKKKTSPFKGLIWAGIILILGVEVVLLFPRERHEEAPAAIAKTKKRAAAPLETIAFDGAQMPPNVTPTPELPAEIQPATAVTPLKPDAVVDALPLETLARVVQPVGALNNEALLRFKSKEAYDEFLKRAKASGLDVKAQLDALLSVRAGYGNLEDLRKELLQRSAEYSEISANYVAGVPRLPVAEERAPGGDVPFGDSVFTAMGISPDVNRSEWGSGFTVAVVDSGVGQHPTFRTDQVTHVDLVNDGQPFDGHGTAMASLIAGNMPGAQGVAPGARILDIRVADSQGNSNSFALAQGIMVAVERGAPVINVSMGSYGNAGVVAEAIQQAVQRGTVVVAAAGNESAAVMAYPAAYSGVISVGGVDGRNQLAYFSNAGGPTFVAPAVGIPSAYFRDNRAFLANGSGTSQSAALVSGAAAAILSHGGNVMLTFNRNVQPLQLPAQSVGAGLVRLPVYR